MVHVVWSWSEYNFARFASCVTSEVIQTNNNNKTPSCTLKEFTLFVSTAVPGKFGLSFKKETEKKGRVLGKGGGGGGETEGKKNKKKMSKKKKQH